MKILVIRFRQMGDAILATSLLNTLRQSFPEAEIHFVLNQKISPLFEGHPSIDRIITFTEEERHAPFTYLKKVWHTVHDEHYDVIIDMRSTINTALFAFLSPSSRFRIGIKKNIVRLAYNNYIKKDPMKSNSENNAHIADALSVIAPIKHTSEFTLVITDEEKMRYKDYLKQMGVDLTKPLLLANVTAKLAHKVWNEDNMVTVMDSFIKNHPDIQVIFNYAPGQEEENARRIYEKLGSPKQVLIDVKAKSSRELVALSSFITLFFGNEGGARHIAHAAGAPSIVICAPENNKHQWIAQNGVPAEGISPSDIATKEQLSTMTRQQQYDMITSEMVSKRLETFYNRIKKKRESSSPYHQATKD